MRIVRSTIAGVFAAAALAAGSAATAERREAVEVHEHVDARHGHDRVYIDRGVTVAAVPRGAVVVRDGPNRYWFHGGVWYRPEGGRFVVIAPPVGVFVPVLPPFYTTLMLGGLAYYYANDAYYVWREPEHQYEVVDPPANVESAAVAPPASESVFIYPNKGQAPEQQAKDRYECHRWAVDQTGFDPTLNEGGVAADQVTAKHSDYQRAMSACLEARDYTVR
ncbi:MAG TPA: DUF6515 family protein [Gammaproteobacteria bacterium]|nr:DUF6515 family protein [Gammaproteobacteria bacterium]